MFRFEQKERLDVESKLPTLAPKMGKEVIDETWRQHPNLLTLAEFLSMEPAETTSDQLVEVRNMIEYLNLIETFRWLFWVLTCLTPSCPTTVSCSSPPGSRHYKSYNSYNLYLDRNGNFFTTVLIWVGKPEEHLKLESNLGKLEQRTVLFYSFNIIIFNKHCCCFVRSCT